MHPTFGSTLARHLPCSLLLALGLGVGLVTAGCPGERAAPRRIDQLGEEPDRSVGPSGEDIPVYDGGEHGSQDPIPGD